MFGTIGHARIKSGRQAQLDALIQEWLQTIRPQIPGEFVQLIGACRWAARGAGLCRPRPRQGDLPAAGRDARAGCLVPAHGRATRG